MESNSQRKVRKFIWNGFVVFGIVVTALLAAYTLFFWILSSAFDISPLPSHSEQIRRFSRNRISFEKFAKEVVDGQIEFRTDDFPRVKFVKVVPEQFRQLGISAISIRNPENWILFEYASGPLDNAHFIVKANESFDASQWYQVTNLTVGWYLVSAK